MYCKNCGTRLNDNAKVCPNCGTFIDDGGGYTLLTSDDRLDDFYSSEPKHEKKKSGALAYIISLILVVAIAGGGAYYYFTHIKPAEKPAPEVAFSTGCGIINEDEPVVYATLSSSNVQYIQGVSLYEYNPDEPENEGVLVSGDYEYTKNIDGTFRAIFFDTTEFKLKNNKTYNYIFEIKLSFIGSSDVFTYTQPVEVKGGFKDSASEIVFDHGKTGSSQTTTEKSEETTSQTTTAKKTDNSFIYESYWYTEPYSEGDTKTIFAFRFNKDNTYVSTRYEKKGDAAWSVSTYNGKFKIDGGYIVASDGSGGEKTYYKIEEASLTEELDGEAVQKLTARKYNSIKNAEDFFGI